MKFDQKGVLETHSSSLATGPLPWIDWLRFLAALEVLLDHVRGSALVEFGSLPAAQHSGVIVAGYAITRLGNEAVILFFVLSGYLVGGKTVERVKCGTFLSMEYTVDRFSRIMTPLLPALALTASIGLITHNDTSAINFLGNVFGMQGILVPAYGSNAPLWSLAYEIWFYTLNGAVAILALGRRVRTCKVIIFIMLTFFAKLEAIYLMCWLLGALAYTRSDKRASYFLFACGVTLVIWGVISIQLGTDTTSVTLSKWRVLAFPSTISRLVLAGGMALIISQIVRMQPKQNWAFQTNLFGAKLAAFSYTLYLTHYPILQLLTSFGLRRSGSINITSLGICLSVISICIAFACIFYWIFERRTKEVRSWLLRLCSTA